MKRILLFVFLLSCYTTQAQLRLVKDIRPGNSASNPDNFINYKNSLFFTISVPNNYIISKTDATPLNTNIYIGNETNTSIDTNNTPNFTTLNNELYFVAEAYINGVNKGVEILKTTGDKTNKYTLVKDINTGASSSFPDKLTVYNNHIYFIATTTDNGRELWKTDGTEAGTTIVKDINPHANNARIGELIVYNNKLFFTANDGVNGDELWSSDGTVSGTQMIKDITQDSQNSTPRSFITFNNKLYFTANDLVTGRELYVSDGTNAGTYQISDLNAGSDGSHPEEITVFNNNLIFSAVTSLGRELVKMNTSESITSLGDINSTGSSNPKNLTIYNSDLYFTAENPSYGKELYKTNGFKSGTVLVADINTGTNSSNPRNLWVYNNILYFRADDGNVGVELWNYNGTSKAATLVADIVVGAGSSNPLPKINYKNEMILTVDNVGNGGRELWAYTDPTLQTYIPDDNFEQLLIDLNYDTTLDDYVDTGKINTITSLTANGTANAISNFTGLQDFKYLQTFNTFLNTESALDLSSLSNLIELNIFQNSNLTNLNLPDKYSNNFKEMNYTLSGLSSLDLSGFDNFESFSTQGDQNLTSLNLSNNISLTNITLTNMPNLINLNISGSYEIQTFNFSNSSNFSTVLDFSDATKMTTLFIENTNMQSIDLSNNNLLTNVFVRNNHLTNLNIKNGANGIISNFNASNNSNLNCINVDDENLSSSGNGVYASWFKDSSATYSEDCIALSVESFKNKKIKIFPNPISNIFRLEDDLKDIETIVIYDINGRKMKTFLKSDHNLYDISELNRGIYIAKVLFENRIKKIKLMKM